MTDDVATLAAANALWSWDRLSGGTTEPETWLRIARVALESAHPYLEAEQDVLRTRLELLERVGDAAFRYLQTAAGHLVDDDVYTDLVDALAALDRNDGIPSDASGEGGGEGRRAA